MVNPRARGFAQTVTPDTLIIDRINQGKADAFYKSARMALRDANAYSVYNNLLKAFSYRNDFDSEAFKRYFVTSLERLFQKGNHIAKLATQLRSAIDKKKSLVAIVKDLNNQKSELEDSILVLKSHIADIKSENLRLKRELAAKDREIERLTDQNDELKSTVQSLSNDLKNKDSIIEQLKDRKWYQLIFSREKS